jgi:methylmalonyl-CoA mutase cobalamin-binding domain/chain
MANDDNNIVLNELEDEKLVQQMHDDMYDGLPNEIAEGTEILLKRGWEPYNVLNEALIAGMKIVGIDFRDGILFVPEVLLAANSMKAGMAILRPLLAASGAPQVGTVVIGTVKGDIHDIGKNLVGMMLEGAGFDVIDIGVNTDAEEYITSLEEHNADILGMSALLTTTMGYMKVVIYELEQRGLRNNYHVIVGGAPLNEDFASNIGADAYCRDAISAVDTSVKLMKKGGLQSKENVI